MPRYFKGSIDKIKVKVKNGRLKLKRRKLKSSVLKKLKSHIRDIKRELICKEARKEAHTVQANMQRDMSNEVRRNFL